MGGKVSAHDQAMYNATNPDDNDNPHLKKRKKKSTSKKAPVKQSTSSSSYQDSKAMHASRATIASYDEATIARRTAIHMLFHHYDTDHSRELSSKELVHLMLELIRDSNTTSKQERMKADDDAKTLLNFLDSDGDAVLEEEEFVDFIVQGMSRTQEQQLKYANSGPSQQVLCDFLKHFSQRVVLCERALDITFPKGQMDQGQFVSFLVQGSHAHDGGANVRRRKGNSLAWGQDDKLWFTAKTILNSKTALGHHRAEKDCIYKDDVMSFMLCGFLINCYDFRVKRNSKVGKNKNKNKTASNLASTGSPVGREKNIHIRLRDIFENCLLVRLIPIMEKAELEADGDWVRRLSMSSWFDEMAHSHGNTHLNHHHFEQTSYLPSHKETGVLTSSNLQANMRRIFTSTFHGHVPREEELQHAIELIDGDNDGIVSKTEFLIFINRMLLTRHTCTSHVSSRTRDISHRVRRAMLLESERRMEVVYQWRSVLEALFRRYSVVRDKETGALLAHAELDEDQAILLFQNIIVAPDAAPDLSTSTNNKQGIALARELFQWCFPVYTNPPPCFVVQNFIAHMIEVLLSHDANFHPDMTKVLKHKVKQELKQRREHSNMCLQAIFQRYIDDHSEITTKDRLTKHCFVDLMAQFGVKFTQVELLSLFKHMNVTTKARKSSTATTTAAGGGGSGGGDGEDEATLVLKKLQRSPSSKLQKRVKQKEFVNFFSRGLTSSYEHRLIFAQRSSIHRKVHDFLTVVENKEKQRVVQLGILFDSVDVEGTGMVHSDALKRIFVYFLVKIKNREIKKSNLAKINEQEPPNQPVLPLIEPSLAQIQLFMNALDDNHDGWLKKEEFNNFFSDAVIRLEAHDDSWLDQIAPCAPMHQDKNDGGGSLLRTMIKDVAVALLYELKQGVPLVVREQHVHKLDGVEEEKKKDDEEEEEEIVDINIDVVAKETKAPKLIPELMLSENESEHETPPKVAPPTPPQDQEQVEVAEKEAVVAEETTVAEEEEGNDLFNLDDFLLDDKKIDEIRLNENEDIFSDHELVVEDSSDDEHDLGSSRNGEKADGEKGNEGKVQGDEATSMELELSDVEDTIEFAGDVLEDSAMHLNMDSDGDEIINDDFDMEEFEIHSDHDGDI